MVAQAIVDCDLAVIPIAGPKVDALVESSTEYSRYVLPASFYGGMNRNIQTYSVAATLVVRNDIPDDVVSLFVTTLLENWDSLREAIPVLPEGNPMERRNDGQSAEIHPGAISAFAQFGG
jgi:TRAP-type uncharacterized transport system substrate-binding protein